MVGGGTDQKNSPRVDRDKIIERLFRAISYSSLSAYSPDDPDVVFVRELLKKIPSNRLSEFYLFLFDPTNKYLNASGNLVRGYLVKAVGDFEEKLKSEIWRKYNLFERTEELYNMLYGLFTLCGAESPYLQDRLERYSNLKLEKIAFKNTSGDTVRFRDEDFKYIEKKGINKVFEEIEHRSAQEIKDEIEEFLKTYYANKYLHKNNGRIMLGNSSGAGNSNDQNGGQKRIGNLLSGSIKKM